MKTLLATLAIIVLFHLPIQGAEVGSCPFGYRQSHGADGGCFKVFKSLLNMDDAQQLCRRQFPEGGDTHGRLAEPRTSEASDLIMDLMREEALTWVWLGGRNDKAGSIVYRWYSDNTEIDTALWSEIPNAYGSWSGVHQWTGGVGGRIGDTDIYGHFAIACEAVNEPESCPRGYTKWPTTNCMKVIKTYYNFHDAETICKSQFPAGGEYQARLAEPKTFDAENLAMRLIIEKVESFGWIGAKNERTGSEIFRWLSDNSVVDPVRFGQTPDTYVNIDSALHLWSGGKGLGKWIGDLPPSTLLPVVCEISGTQEQGKQIDLEVEEGECPVGYEQSNGGDKGCFRVFNSIVKMGEGEDYCQNEFAGRKKWHGRLAEPRTQQASDLIMQLMKDASPVQTWTWLGGRNDKAGSRVYRWVSDKEEINPSLWGETPNAYGAWSGLHQFTGGINGWIGDTDINTYSAFTCEAVNEPAACPEGYTKWPDTNCIKVLYPYYKWHDAITLCKNQFPEGHEHAARLAEPRNGNQENLIMHLIMEAGETFAWLGGRNDRAGSKIYRWQSDNTVVSSDLYGEEPNGYGVNAALHQWNGGRGLGHWIGDYDLNARWPVVCEIIPAE